MQIKMIEKDGYRLHLIKTNNFKTTYVKTIFWNKLKKEEVTTRNFLLQMLLFSCFDYKTSKEITIEKEKLYGLITNMLNYRLGENIYSEITMSVIDDKYTEKGLFKKSLEFYFNLLQNPNIKENSFDKESFNIVKDIIKTDINSVDENPTSYSLKKYKELLENDIYKTPIVGTLKDLEKINEESLYKYYQNFIISNYIDIIIVGNIDFEITEKYINELCKLKGQKHQINNIEISYEKEKTEDIINSNFVQSRLIMGGSLKKLTTEEKKYAFQIYNIIFGNSPKSKLFEIIREKYSYAYTISSSYSRHDNLFLIEAGLSSKNYETTKEEVLKQIEEMKKGHFTLKEINNAKNIILSIIDEIDDYEGAISNHYFNNLYTGVDKIKDQKQKIKSITKKDIINVANKINIDTILLAKEKSNGRN